MRRTLLLLVSSSALLAGCNCGKPQGLLETFGVLVASPEVDFGPVTEFTQKTLPLSLENQGRGALTLSLELEAGTSGEFTMGPAPVELASGAKVDVELTFAALGAGEDTGAVIITSDEPDRGPVRVPLHAGAIFPVLIFDQDPLVFAPVTSSLVTKQAVIHNVGGATLHVNSIGVHPSGSPDFSITPPVLPLSLAPDASVPVSVTYARSLNTTEGLMLVVSDDPDGGDRSLRLLPDPARVCGDGLDNDNDGLTDFPDDIGCTSTEDSDEFNPPECVNGGAQPCGSTTGACRQGTRVCANSIWGGCDGGVRSSPETCNGQDDDCNGMSDENLSELCSINGCPGARACVPNSGTDGGLFTACIPISSMPEVCNGVDDNCNGAVDEGVVQTCTVFGCLGVRVCVPGTDGGFTSCMPTNPLPESCNGVDDDCNGVVDEVPDLICGIGPCRRVAPACVDGGIGACLPANPGTEVCNGVDDDCNGTADDSIAPLSCGTGACTNTALACLIDGGMNVCVPTPPSAETCNNIDDNCNGVRDEQADGGALTQACYTGLPAGTRNVGRCREGASSCASGSWGGCVGEVIPGTETCNNIDDNCNGSIDDGLANLTCGVGACFRSVTACVGGTPQTCTPGTGSAETCNNVDDNCNNQVDESLTRACYTGPVPTRLVGRCRDGTQTCTTGTWTATCPGQVLPNPTEICGNAIDDNCAGGVDEGCSSCDPLTMGTWYSHHSFNPATGLPTPRNVSQFAQVEMAATRITAPAGAFPLTISHVRVLGQAPQNYTILIYNDSFGVPGSQLGSQAFTADGQYQVVALTTPVTVATSQPLWIALQGAADSMTVRGDGDGEATSNLIYGCDLYWPPTCLGSWSWNTFNSFGTSFALVDDLIIAIAKCP
ncbi:MAG: MopE-related protein [Archangium sp.]|nr:MopE-related protein [Archangium sp.]